MDSIISPWVDLRPVMIAYRRGNNDAFKDITVLPPAVTSSQRVGVRNVRCYALS